MKINFPKCFQQTTYGFQVNDASEALSTVIILPLTAGQEITVEHTSLTALDGADNTNGMFSYFAGYLIFVN